MNSPAILSLRRADFSPHQPEIRVPRNCWRGSPQCLLAVILLATLAAHGQGGGTAESGPAAIRLNTVGYLPGQAKVASIPQGCTNFFVVRVSDDSVVYSNTVTGPVWNADTGEQIWQADFSTVHATGKFRVTAPGAGGSPVFTIGPEVWQEPFWLVERGFYLWRCGTAVSEAWQGQTFAHGACHTNDAWLDFATGGHTNVASTRGWHDAGDFNKYVVNAGVTVGVLFRAWDDFGPAIQKVPLGLPAAADQPPGLPDFLAEIKWETDWLLTMQAPDGSVYHKVSTQWFGGFIMPEDEHTPRYFTPWSSAATADFVAMLALGAREFRPYAPAYADQCLAAATKSYAFLTAHPENHRADQSQFHTGTYEVNDRSARLWAAAELWEATGRPDCLQDFEQRCSAGGARVDASFDYANVGDLGEFTYLFSHRAGRNESLVGLLRTHLLVMADGIVQKQQAHGYGRPLGSNYGWGGNGAVARQTVILHAASRLDPRPEYAAASYAALDFLLGRNVHGRSYVTGLGFHPPEHPHDRRSGADNIVEPWPGYLVGGPNPGAKDWHDVQADYRTNEIAINWQAALVYALAAALE